MSDDELTRQWDECRRLTLEMMIASMMLPAHLVNGHLEEGMEADASLLVDRAPALPHPRTPQPG